MGFRAISIRTMLLGLAVLPLAIIALVGGLQAWRYHAEYAALQKAVPIGVLADAGARLALALPAEAMAPREAYPRLRPATDAAIATVLDDYDALVAAGFSDPVIAEAIAVIRDGQAKVGPFRQRTDAGTAAPNEALFLLQPVSAAGLKLMDRAGAIVPDLALARFIAGYHALMQTNDSGLIEQNLGGMLLGGQALPMPAFAFAIHSRNLRDTHRAAMMDFLPAEVTAPYLRFHAGPQGATIAAVRKDLYRNDPAALESNVTAKQWVELKTAERPIMLAAIAAAGRELGALAQARLAEARGAFQLYLGLTIAVVLAVSGLCFFTVRSISASIRGIAGRMHTLAEGDVAAPIPFGDRADEIGEMARSVEVFRQSALRNLQLERETAQQRAEAERQREAMQREAAAQAEARLRQATGSLAASLKRLAEGDLLCEIEERFDDQFEGLRTDFNTSVRQLRSALAEAVRSASIVGGGSNEISQASENLARRTEQQAAALEETAASLDQITANVTATSRRTAEARDLVRSTRSKAEQSGAVVRNAVEAMERIDQSARQITQIIGVIDEIAFQTSLLALNAGVEAARAGDAGRGFAVVAQEVRALAQRSAEAAKQIKGLIANSERTVGEGVQLVTETGGGLSAIEELIQSIDAHMDAIASAAADQSNSLAEVNIAMNDMDKSTQQNAAMVQEVSASGDELRLESARLAEMLARFRTGAGAGDLRHAAQAMRAPAQRQAPKPAARAVRPATAGNTALAQTGDSWQDF